MLHGRDCLDHHRAGGRLARGQDHRFAAAGCCAISAVGLIGSLVGGFLARKLGIQVMPDFWGELITAIVGAVIFLLIWQAIRRA